MDIQKIIRQKDNGCGPTSLAMMLQYLGEKKTEQDILEGIGGITAVTNSGIKGTFVVDNALYAANLGYPVHCYVYNTGLLGKEFENMETNVLKGKLQELIHHRKGIDLRILKTYIKLIDENVDFRVKAPRLDDLSYFFELETPVPVMLNVSSRILYTNDAPKELGHSIVATSYDGKKVYFNDPDGYLAHIEPERLMKAWLDYSLTHSAHMIAVLPKPIK